MTILQLYYIPVSQISRAPAHGTRLELENAGPRNAIHKNWVTSLPERPK
jgi:hypothetical protein